MAAKEILFNSNARKQIANGLNTLANAVKVTLGLRGRNAVLDRSWGAPTITKDGVTVAKEIELENHFANMGAQMVKEVASRIRISGSPVTRGRDHGHARRPTRKRTTPTTRFVVDDELC